jgi:hypothetical protein
LSAFHQVIAPRVRRHFSTIVSAGSSSPSAGFGLDIARAITSIGIHQVSIRPVSPARRISARCSDVVSSASLASIASPRRTRWAHDGESDQASPVTHEIAVMTQALPSSTDTGPEMRSKRSIASSMVWVSVMG